MNKEGFRVYLRALEPEDYKVSIRWRKDEEIWDMLVGRKYYVSEEYERQWVLDVIQGKYEKVVLAVCLKENDSYIGNVYLNNIDWFNKNASSAILMGDRQFWGRGYGTEVIVLMLYHAFYDLGLQRIQARQLLSNKASIKTYEKCGFISEGVLRRAVYKDGGYQDLNLMSIIREDFDEILKKRGLNK